MNPEHGTFRIKSRTVPPPTPVMTASHVNPMTSMPLREATSAPDTANTTTASTHQKGNQAGQVRCVDQRGLDHGIGLFGANPRGVGH